MNVMFHHTIFICLVVFSVNCEFDGDLGGFEKIPEAGSSNNTGGAPENFPSPPPSPELNPPVQSKPKKNNPGPGVRTIVVSAHTQEGDDLLCSEKRGPLTPLRHNSKYLADSRNRYTFEKGKKLCAEYDLVMGELEGLPDHRTIQQFISSFKSAAAFSSANDKFFIGVNDIKDEGVYLRADKKPLVFQNYHTSQPDDRGNEDCTVLGKEVLEGPVGSSDENCTKPFHLLCMFRVNTQCYNESYETVQNRLLEKDFGIKLISNVSERQFYISNFQASWKVAHEKCLSQGMNLISMDKHATPNFFKTLIKWEDNFLNTTFPVVQYWTSGKFKGTHMKAEVYWYPKPNMTDSEERSIKKDFTFSGLFKWSTRKKTDPGGEQGYRRDLCLSFGLEGKPDGTPFVRNTNCNIPCYFVCSKNEEIRAE